MVNFKLKRLQEGETIITSEKGNSMVPLIYSGQDHELSPVDLKDVKVNDIVYCKVHGRFFTHLVKAIDPVKGCQIANNKGFVNGWTRQVFGKVTKVL